MNSCKGWSVGTTRKMLEPDFDFVRKKANGERRWECTRGVMPIPANAR
jgi:hypothetical protein